MTTANSEISAETRNVKLSGERRPTLEQHAREMLGLAPEWQVFKWEAIGTYPNKHGVTVTGATVLEMFKKGPRKGTPNWRKAEPGTELSVSIPDPVHAEWLKHWEASTGFCSECEGSRQTVASIGVGGTTYRPCRKCDATGRSLTGRESTNG